MSTSTRQRLLTTPAGLRRTQARLQSALDSYDKIVSTNAEAADAGDSSVWHDNFAYEENQRQMHQWARRIRDMRLMLTRIEVISPPSDPERVQVGCTVTVYDLGREQEHTYVIAGYEDGDLEQNRLSYTAPLARALIGAEEGDIRSFQAGARQRRLEVLSIEPTREV
jgi:transcription elongation GreA/GreB family factor